MRAVGIHLAVAIIRIITKINYGRVGAGAARDFAEPNICSPEPTSTEINLHPCCLFIIYARLLVHFIANLVEQLSGFRGEMLVH